MIVFLPLILLGWGFHEYVLFAQRMLPFVVVALMTLVWATAQQMRRRAVPGEPGNDLEALGLWADQD